MKPISLQVYAEYEEIVNRLMAAMGKHNPEGRVISRTHVLRYALRVADGNGSIEENVRKILVEEETRGRKVPDAPASERPKPRRNHEPRTRREG